MSFPDKIYFEPAVLDYPMGIMLSKKFSQIPWIEINSHNNIPELRSNPNSAFPIMKRHLILGIRKTHRYVENYKVSDYLVPYTSSGCQASCLYCYLVCNYNKCAYLRLFVNREQMLEKMLKTARNATRRLCFEIGSNSDLVLENTISDNLPWTIENFAKDGKGQITFPTKFDLIEPLLKLDHRERTIFRMSVNPEIIIKEIEIGTSPLLRRIRAVNRMCEAGYPIGILIAPVILISDWKNAYSKLLDILEAELSAQVKKSAFLEIIFMTYSYVHQAINTEAYPEAMQLYQKELMTGRGRGKYCYREPLRTEGEAFLRGELAKKLPDMKILYVV